MRHIRLREFLVAVEGLALYRNLFEDDDDAAAARIDEVRKIVKDDEPYALGIDVPELNARAGYAAWSVPEGSPGFDAGLRTVLGAPPGWCRASSAAEAAGYAGRLGEDCPKPGATPAVLLRNSRGAEPRRPSTWNVRYR